MNLWVCRSHWDIRFSDRRRLRAAVRWGNTVCLRHSATLPYPMKRGRPGSTAAGRTTPIEYLDQDEGVTGDTPPAFHCYRIVI
ncbi:hypothetical protein [Nocardia sp. KC 131]|uniref:hypothetical protein n=1 Tax=Nocardia arseniciresistens TaxID=3392119 RepID=UPI00398EB859